jgi:hypothetical protein
MADQLPDPFSTDRDGLVDHGLEMGSEPVFRARFHHDPEIRRIDDFSGHPTDHDRPMVFWKSVRLNDDRRTRFSVIAGCGDDYDVTPPHPYRIRKPLDPIESPALVVRIQMRHLTRHWLV